jgi:sporulation protein YlmC with PRC-barrel domain
MDQPTPHSPLRLPVRTESGRSLGSVVDVEVLSDSHHIAFYLVKPSRLMPDAMWSPLRIHRSQVIEISAQGLVVEDAVLRNRGQQPAAEAN